MCRGGPAPERREGINPSPTEKGIEGFLCLLCRGGVNPRPKNMWIHLVLFSE